MSSSQSSLSLVKGLSVSSVIGLGQSLGLACLSSFAFSSFIGHT